MKSTLITLSEAWQIYCAKSRQVMQNRHSDIFYEFNNYINFVNQSLKLKYFIPCDKNGKPLEEPNKKDYIFRTKEQFIEDKKQYQQAQERILFKVFKSVNADNKTMTLCDEYGLEIYYSFKFGFIWLGVELKSIQDLIGKVELVELKHKELNL